jgi:hypothetical protein
VITFVTNEACARSTTSERFAMRNGNHAVTRPVPNQDWNVEVRHDLCAFEPIAHERSRHEEASGDVGDARERRFEHERSWPPVARHSAEQEPQFDFPVVRLEEGALETRHAASSVEIGPHDEARKEDEALE